MNLSAPTMQRLLTRTEQASFMARHPVTAARVAETKAAMLAGLYDFNYYDLVGPFVWRVEFPGIIEPIGDQVDDASYGLVTIQPAPDGEIYFTGWTDHVLGTNKPPYESPPDPRGPLDDLKALGYLALGVGVVGVLISASRKRG